MLMHEACRVSGLTKKAVDYYVAQGLVQPELLGNGYRGFSEGDVERLKRISTLRRLGLPVQEIRTALDGGQMLAAAARRRALAAEAEEARAKVLRRLAETGDWSDADAQLEALEQKQTIQERLLTAFPGYYGQYVSLHFGRYLNGPVTSEAQRTAFAEVVAFLDRVSLHLPPELQEYLDETAKGLDGALVEAVQADVDNAVQDIEAYLTAHQEELEQYLRLKESGEFQQSPAGRLAAELRRFQAAAGYRDILIPAMKRLSPAYRAYHDALEQANRVFLERYPGAANGPEAVG